MRPQPLRHHSLHRLFAGLVEDSLYAELGICDPSLADYLTGLLMDFIHVDHVFALRDARGRRLEQVAEMLTDAARPPGLSDADHRRLVHKHVGDFTLFWSGVYPENLRRLRGGQRKDALLDYLNQGKRSYAIASELWDDETPPPPHVFRRLSDQFEECVYGLALVRRGWESTDPEGFRGLRRLWE